MAEKQGPYPPQPGATDAPPPAYSAGPSQPAPYPVSPPGAAPYPAGQQPYPGAYQQGMPPPAGYPAGPPPVGPDGKPLVQPAGQPMMHQPMMAPPGGYIAGQPVAAASTVVVVQQHMFRQLPVNTVCPHCHQNIITSTNAEAGGLTWLLCAGICLFGFWLGCCLIPFCIDDCQDIRHSCPNCKNTIHVFRRL